MGISFEACMLAAAIVWGFVQLVAAAQAANVQYGLKWAASPRDIEMPPLNPVPGRINRNFRNYMETFPFFAAATSSLSLQAFTTG
ncbi:putative MAPEG superfamily protein [Bradyrhizobium sp. CIR48]|nr:MAPEG family protein [Bradyrhizobium sp. CIR48]MBB4421742.1 putative MAPEG superfamily protein [Bradyrhizobium sp. CIR48]